MQRYSQNRITNALGDIRASTGARLAKAGEAYGGLSSVLSSAPSFYNLTGPIMQREGQTGMQTLNEYHNRAMSHTKAVATGFYNASFRDGSRNEQVLRGFDFGNLMDITSQLASRGGKGNLFADRNASIGAKTQGLQDLTGTLAAARNVFGGDKSSVELTREIEKFMNIDLSKVSGGKMQGVQRKLQQVAALAASLNMTAESMVAVHETIESGVGAVQGLSQAHMRRGMGQGVTDVATRDTMMIARMKGVTSPEGIAEIAAQQTAVSARIHGSKQGRILKVAGLMHSLSPELVTTDDIDQIRKLATDPNASRQALDTYIRNISARSGGALDVHKLASTEAGVRFTEDLVTDRRGRQSAQGAMADMEKLARAADRREKQSREAAMQLQAENQNMARAERRMGIGPTMTDSQREAQYLRGVTARVGGIESLPAAAKSEILNTISEMRAEGASVSDIQRFLGSDRRITETVGTEALHLSGIESVTNARRASFAVSSDEFRKRGAGGVVSSAVFSQIEAQGLMRGGMVEARKAAEAGDFEKARRLFSQALGSKEFTTAQARRIAGIREREFESINRQRGFIEADSGRVDPSIMMLNELFGGDTEQRRGTEDLAELTGGPMPQFSEAATKKLEKDMLDTVTPAGGKTRSRRRADLGFDADMAGGTSFRSDVTSDRIERRRKESGPTTGGGATGDIQVVTLAPGTRLDLVTPSGVKINAVVPGS
jgi:hypothetical protein